LFDRGGIDYLFGGADRDLLDGGDDGLRDDLNGGNRWQLPDSFRDGGCIGRGEFEWALTRVGVIELFAVERQNRPYSTTTAFECAFRPIANRNASS
jgi:hypothetical protein